MYFLVSDVCWMLIHVTIVVSVKGNMWNSYQTTQMRHSLCRTQEPHEPIVIYYFDSCFLRNLRSIQKFRTMPFQILGDSRHTAPFR